MAEREKIAKDWKARGFGCDLWRDPPGRVWEDYVHDTDELLMVLEGDVEVEIEGRKLRPKGDEEILIPAGARHSVRNKGKTESRWLYGYKR